MTPVAERERARIRAILKMKSPAARFWDGLSRVEKEAFFYVCRIPVRHYDEMTGREWEQLSQSHRERILEYIRKQTQLATLCGVGHG